MKTLCAKLMAIVVVLTIVVGCGSENKQGSYVNIIPDNTIALMQVNLYPEMEKSGALDLIEPYRAEAAEFVGGQAGALLKSVVLDMDNTGIATTQPIYAYAEGTNEDNFRFVVVAQVGNKEKLDALVDFTSENVIDIDKKTIEQNTILSIDNADFAKIGYNSCALVVVVAPEKVTSKEVAALLNKAYTPRTTALKVTNNPIEVNLSMDNLSTLLKSFDDMDAEVLEVLETLKGIEINFDNLVQGGINKHVLSIDGMSDASLKEALSYFTPVEDSFIDNVPSDAWAVANINLGDKLITEVLEFVEENSDMICYQAGISTEELELAASFIKTISGDVTFSLNEVNVASYDPDGTALAMVGTKNDALYKYISTFAVLDGATMNNDVITVVEDGITFNIGQQDEGVWVGVNTTPVMGADNATSSNWYSRVKGKIGYAVINTNAIFNDKTLRRLLIEELNYEFDYPEQVDLVMDIIDVMDYIVAYSEVDAEQGDFTITFEQVAKDTKTNFGKQFIDIIEPFVKEAIDEML